MVVLAVLPWETTLVSMEAVLVLVEQVVLSTLNVVDVEDRHHWCCCYVNEVVEEAVEV